MYTTGLAHRTLEPRRLFRYPPWSSMTITAEQADSIQIEETVFNQSIDSLRQQLVQAEDKLFRENQRARALTSEIHETRRVEDKALLASDEAVSHGLKDTKREEVDTLRKQLLNPYFARIKLEEQQPSGQTSIIEYKLGLSANTDLRIIDWRRAPISKLYYEYQEGNDYVEEILGRERVGKVLLRTRVDVQKGTLAAIHNRFGSFRWNAAGACWEASGVGAPKNKTNDSELPEILSLITPEQFSSITTDATTAVLIQGVAGSGKTTVALHRLAWLLHHDNSPLRPSEITFLVLSPALRAYVENSLPSVGISGVPVRTYHEWASRTLRGLAAAQEIAIHRPESEPPHATTRVKRSMALLATIEQRARDMTATGTPLEQSRQVLLALLTDPRSILDHDSTRLLTADAINGACLITKANFERNVFDWHDDALLLRIHQLRQSRSPITQDTPPLRGHIVIDEVQDLSPVELATIVSSVRSPADLTLVGDTGQNLDPTASFPGWEALRATWNLSDETSRYITLQVSHRSTLPIMRFADFIQERPQVTEGRAGRTPIWFKCRNESHGIEQALKWLEKAVELYPTRITAVLCASERDAAFAFRMLQPTFGPRVRLADRYAFSFQEGITVTDIRHVKGLEFCSVLLWNPSHKSYPAGELSRNLLYVAATRAEENLCIVSWERPSPLLPQFGSSKLIRSMDLTVQE